MWSQIFYLSATFLAYTLTWSGTLFMNPNLKINAFLKALYASLHRPIFSFCICAIPLLFSIGDGLGNYENNKLLLILQRQYQNYKKNFKLNKTFIFLDLEQY